MEVLIGLAVLFVLIGSLLGFVAVALAGSVRGDLEGLRRELLALRREVTDLRDAAASQPATAPKATPHPAEVTPPTAEAARPQDAGSGLGVGSLLFPFLPRIHT